MNALNNKLIPAALFIGIASVVMTTPAQALSLNGSMQFGGAADFSKSGSTYTFDFGASDPNAHNWICLGDFYCIDDIAIADFTITNGLLNSAPISPMISGISTKHGNVDFVLQSVSNVVDTILSPSTGSVAFNLHGYFTDGSGRNLGNGSMSGTYDPGENLFTGKLTPVPTPAAVLPVLGGLFGFASKRKQEAEGNA